MRKQVLFSVLLSSCYFMAAGMAQSQQSSTEAGRKVIRRVEPLYPEMAKKVNLIGTVKMLAVVAPDGNVKTVQPVGGSPILVQAAQYAILKWKFAPASAESKELVEIHFRPE